MLKWITEHISEKFDSIYIGKPPEKPDDFIGIFNEKFRLPWYLRIFKPFISNIRSLHQAPEFLNKKLKKRLIFF